MIQRGTTKKSHRNRSIGGSNELGRAFCRCFRKSHDQNWLIERILVFGFVLHFFTTSQLAQALELTYGGRLALPSGEPLAGPLDLTFRFYRDASGGTALATVPVPSVPLVDGVFQTSLNLSAEDLGRLFEDGDKTVFVEVESQGKVYPRQKFSYVPLALRVPVDGSKITYDSEGRLTISSGALSASASLPGATGTGGVEKVGDQTYSTYALSAAGKSLVGAVDLAAQKSILGLGVLDGVTSSVQTQLNSKLPLSGGTMTGAISMGGSHKITNLADPTDSGDAAKKSYVDSKLGGQTLVVGTPSPGQVIKWDGSKFALSADAVGVAGGGIASLNALTSGSQSLAVETPGVTSGTRPAWTADSGTSTHTLTIPLASASGVTAGLISKVDFELFSSKQSPITPSSVLATGSMTTNLQNALEIKPYGTSAAQTGELRFRELTASGLNYVGLKAPDTLETNTIWMLPQGDGPSGHVLSTDGSGRLSWISPSSGSVTSIVSGTGLTGGSISSAGTISLANVGTAGTYTKVTTNAQGQVISGASLAATDIPNLSAAKITSGTLSVALGGTGATSFTNNGVLVGSGSSPLSATLAGSPYQVLRAEAGGTPAFGALSLDQAAAVTGILPINRGGTGGATAADARISLGLGSLATASSVSGATIDDGSILNADISASAAIADTKLATIATVGKVANSATTATSANTSSAIVARDASGNFSAGTITATLNGHATNVTGTVAVANGGTGATTAPQARSNLGAAAAGANTDITSLSGLTSLTTSGNVGIGTTAASTKLHAVGDTQLEGQLMMLNVQNGRTINFNKIVTTPTWYKVATVTESQAKASFRIQGVVNDVHKYNTVDITVTLNNLATDIASNVLWNTVYHNSADLFSYFGLVVVIENTTTAHLYVKTAPIANTVLNLDITANAKNANYLAKPVFYPNTSFAMTSFNDTMTTTTDPSLSGILYQFDVYTHPNTRFLRMMDVNGNVGIGSTSPGAKLDVMGGGRFSNQNGLELAPYSTLSGNTSELRFDELTANGSHYVGFKAPNAISSSMIWTLPATDGTGGSVLSTNGSGTLSWVSPSTGSVTNIAAGTGLTGGPITSTGTIALANVGTAGSYTKVTTNAQGQVITGASLTATDIPALDASKITTGTISVALGGTGATSFTNNGVLVGSGASNLSATAAGTQYQVFRAGAGGVPAFGSISLDQSAAVTGALGLANGGTGAVTAAAARTNLGLGTAATLNVGTAASNVVQLDANSKLPTVDGTQVMGVVKTAGDTMTGTLNLPSNGLLAGANQLVLSGGNVGIGTTTPLALLAVGSGSIADSNLPIQISANGTMAYYGANRSNGAYGALFGWDNAYGGAVVRSANAADDLSLVVNGGTRAVTIKPAGNVGIGTTNPGSTLDVNGNLNVSGSIGVESWISPSFQNGWVNYGGSYEPAGYYKDKFGVVYIKGLVKNGTLSSSIFTLPVGYRPNYIRHLPALTSTSLITTCILYIYPDGGVIPHGACNAGWISIEVSFRP